VRFSPSLVSCGVADASELVDAISVHWPGRVLRAFYNELQNCPKYFVVDSTLDLRMYVGVNGGPAGPLTNQMRVTGLLSVPLPRLTPTYRVGDVDRCVVLVRNAPAYLRLGRTELETARDLGQRANDCDAKRFAFAGLPPERQSLNKELSASDQACFLTTWRMDGVRAPWDRQAKPSAVLIFESASLIVSALREDVVQVRACACALLSRPPARPPSR
jgi:hypothetical protein